MDTLQKIMITRMIGEDMVNEVIISPTKIIEGEYGIELEIDYTDVYNKINLYRSKNTSNPDNIVVKMPKSKLSISK